MAIVTEFNVAAEINGRITGKLECFKDACNGDIGVIRGAIKRCYQPITRWASEKNTDKQYEVCRFYGHETFSFLKIYFSYLIYGVVHSNRSHNALVVKASKTLYSGEVFY